MARGLATVILRFIRNPVMFLIPIDLTFEVVRLHHAVLMCIILYKCYIFTFPRL